MSRWFRLWWSRGSTRTPTKYHFLRFENEESADPVGFSRRGMKRVRLSLPDPSHWGLKTTFISGRGGVVNRLRPLLIRILHNICPSTPHWTSIEPQNCSNPRPKSFQNQVAHALDNEKRESLFFALPSMHFTSFGLSGRPQNPCKNMLKSHAHPLWNLCQQKIPKYLQTHPQRLPQTLQNGRRRTPHIAFQEKEDDFGPFS